MRLGGIDKLTMRRFDLLWVTQVEELSPNEIQALRGKAGVDCLLVPAWGRKPR